MWSTSQDYIVRYYGFFYISLSHESLTNYYQTNFSLLQHHKYSLEELENMIPFEKTFYVTMLIQYIEKENERVKAQNAGR